MFDLSQVLAVGNEFSKWGGHKKTRLNIQIWNSETCCDISYVRLPNLYGFIVPCTYLIQKQSYFHMPWRKEDNFEKVIWRKKNCSKFEALKESLQFELPIRKLPFYLILHRNVNHTSTNIEKHSQILIMYFFLALWYHFWASRDGILWYWNMYECN